MATGLCIMPSLHGESALTDSAGRYSRAVARDFFSRYRAIIEAETEGAVDVLSRWELVSPSLRRDWCRTLGALAHGLAEAGTANPVSHWVDFLLHLTVSGTQGAWRAKLENATTLLHGTTLLQGINILEVQQLAENRRKFVFSSSTDYSTDLDFIRWADLKVPIIPAEVIRALQSRTSQLFSPDDLSQDEASLNNLAQAMAILDGPGKPYGDWVRRVLRVVVPVMAPEGLTMSSSDALLPGVITLSLSHSPIMIGELLVHESAHQYFHLLEQTGPVENGTDTALYYSPFRRADRPIRAILLAYHAFVNVTLYYHRLTSVAYAKDFSSEAIADILPKLKELERALIASPGLTLNGRDMWQRLAEQIRVLP